jgi:hypothetical protein
MASSKISATRIAILLWIGLGTLFAFIAWLHYNQGSFGIASTNANQTARRLVDQNYSNRSDYVAEMVYLIRDNQISKSGELYPLLERLEFRRFGYVLDDTQRAALAKEFGTSRTKRPDFPIPPIPQQAPNQIIHSGTIKIKSG